MKDVTMNMPVLQEDVKIAPANESTETRVALYGERSDDDENAQFAGDHFMRGLGKVLSLWVREGAVANMPGKIGRFHSSQPPSLSIQDYITRLQKYFRCSEECFVIALVYIDRITKNNASVSVCDVTIHRLLVIAVVIAAKFHDDKFYDNRYYGKAGGLSLRETNMLEAFMLSELNWRMLVAAQEYELYRDLVCKAIEFQA